MKINKLFLLIAISLLVFSCNKEDSTSDDGTSNNDNDSIDLTEQEINTIISGDESKTWNASNFTLAGNSQSCRLDDSFTFNSNHTYQYDGGSELCGSEDDMTIKSGVWTVDADNNKLIFNQGEDNEYIATIESISSSNIKLGSTYMLMPVMGQYTPQ